jgi:hypothetical protein
MSIDTPILANMVTPHNAGVTNKGKNVMTARNFSTTASVQGLYYHKTYLLNPHITFFTLYINIKAHGFHLLST